MAMKFLICALFACSLIGALSAFTLTQWAAIANPRLKTFFSTDYELTEGAFYKLHSEQRTWMQAWSTCHDEGAYLAMPTGIRETEIMLRYMKDKLPGNTNGIFIGDGEPLIHEDITCMVMLPDLIFKIESCSSEFPFICKKILDGDTNEIRNLNYKFQASFDNGIATNNYDETSSSYGRETIDSYNSITSTNNIDESSNDDVGEITASSETPNNIYDETSDNDDRETSSSYDSETASNNYHTPAYYESATTASYDSETSTNYNYYLETAYNYDQENTASYDSETSTNKYDDTSDHYDQKTTAKNFESETGIIDHFDDISGNYNRETENKHEYERDHLRFGRETKPNDWFKNGKNTYLRGDVAPWSVVPTLDYEYQLCEQSASYKLHIDEQPWARAVAMCRSEGAHLLVPETSAEVEAILRFSVDGLPCEEDGMFVGIHDLYEKGTFMTVDGRFLSEVWHDWRADEPNNADDEEHCGMLMTSGKLNNADCSASLPFICKKEMSTVEYNDICKTKVLFNDISTQTVQEFAPDRYTFHPHPKTWYDANETCHSQGSYLAIINSAEEAEMLVKEFAKHPTHTLPDSIHREVLLLGFYKEFDGHFRTVKGTPLSETGYTKWGDGQPDNDIDNENCGSMLRDGRLNDIQCGIPCVFICERDNN